MRLRASIVIPAWNEWSLTRACLETLRPTLGVRDEVIVVDNGSQDETADGLRRYPWVRVVSRDENVGFAAGCNSGAAVATGDVLVFLNNDTLLPARWLDGLLEPLADSGIAASGPRSNFVSGPQLCDEADYDPSRTSELQRFARTWRERHRHRTTDVTRLVGFCLAVRRSAFEQAGGFDEGFGLGGAEDDDLCLRLADAGHRLVIAHESFVHHHGHRTFDAHGVDWLQLQERNVRRLAGKRSRRERDVDAPLLSACLIVKDEEATLGACLASLQGVVDEVVVYDTGSTDGTVELARATGATVLEGYWDDDFGRARNAALAHCRGEWILHVDADEVLAGEPTALRDQLRRELASATHDALGVRIENLADSGLVGFAHLGVRLFRRAGARWHGALHEQVVDSHGAVVPAGRSSLTIVHSGYTSQAFQSKDKHARNVRVAQQGLDASGGSDALAAVNLGRSLRASGLYDDALLHLERATRQATDRGVRRQAWRVGAETLIDLGRCSESLTWVEELRRHTSSSSVPDYLEALARLGRGETDRALQMLAALEGGARDEDLDVPAHVLRAKRGLALVAAQRWEEAAAELAASAAEGGGDAVPWVQLVEAHWRAGAPLDALVPHLRGELVHVLAQVVHAATEAADAFADALWRQDVSRAHVLALVSQLSTRLALPRALEWSARMRSHGLVEDCPLAVLAASGHDPLDRLRACAVLVTAFSDERGHDAMAEVAALVPVEQLLSALQAVDELAPTLLVPFLRAAATDHRRTTVLARILEDLGAGGVLQELVQQPA